MELLKYVNDIRNERCHIRAKYCKNQKIACVECPKYNKCITSCVISCNTNQCFCKDNCNSLVKTKKIEGGVHINEIICDENNKPILFNGKEMTLDDFKRCIGRVDDPWVDYMNLVIGKKRENKLIIGKEN